MTRILALIAAIALAPSTSAITIVTVPVGDVGNANDPATGNLYGGVNYAYNIGKYEVTIGQYAAFLNAVAATDTYSLYYPTLATDSRVRGIARSGTSGHYSYSVLGSENHPISFISWGDAARFANWLHNGQPTGSQGPGTTETGAYTLNGATTNTALMAVTRNPAATWYIPNENEWYKAAYYQPAAQGGDTDDYWTYPMKTNSVPYSDQPSGATPDNIRVGNFFRDDGVANGYDDGYAVCGSATCSIGQNYLTDVGAYTSSPSYYGTFDQGGNLYEWNETAIQGERGIRGGAWEYLDNVLRSTGRFYNQPDDNYINVFGFRLASSLPSDDIGDFNHDGAVNAADYVVLRKDNAPQPDFDKWRSNFGQPAGAGTITGERGNVPEPSVFVLLAFIACTSVASRYRKSARCILV